MKVDETDESIIAALKKDSRASNVSIGKALGITEGAVRWRVARLLRAGIIRSFTIDVSEGANTFAILMVKARGETKKMMSSISSLSVHRDAYEISGEYDGCLIIEGPSVGAIDQKIDSIRKLKEVADTRTFISFRRW
ncbi:MAG: Lrp/AsnC family transcriptional regulator [Candidatus Micrarchaeia archaeon]